MALGLQTYALCLAFCVVVENQTSSLQDCVANTLTPEPLHVKQHLVEQHSRPLPGASVKPCATNTFILRDAVKSTTHDSIFLFVKLIKEKITNSFLSLD